MRDEELNRCPTCQEDLDYDPQGYPCEKCEWWEDEHKREEEKYQRLMWEREEWERLYGPDGLGRRK